LNFSLFLEYGIFAGTPIYQSTLSLRTNMNTQPVGSIPMIELEHTEHLFAVEQRNGIIEDRIREIYELITQLSVETES
jgi:hypothetical protein